MDSWLLPQLAEHGAALLGSAVALNTLLIFAGTLAFALLAASSSATPDPHPGALRHAHR